MKKVTKALAAAIAGVSSLALATAWASGPLMCGDVNGSGGVTTGDALLVLKKAVGQQVDLLCAAGAVVLKTGQTASYGAGTDGAVQAGAERSFTDNGDGTVTDNTTGLMWEKKDRSGSVHEQNAFVIWSDSGSALDGNLATWFLAQLNDGSGFAGHTDWRLPNQFELLSLLDYGRTNPSIAPEFNTNCTPGCTVLTCSCTRADFYWSSTTLVDFPSQAWTVNFTSGLAAPTYKTMASATVRAVRNAN